MPCIQYLASTIRIGRLSYAAEIPEKYAEPGNRNENRKELWYHDYTKPERGSDAAVQRRNGPERTVGKEFCRSGKRRCRRRRPASLMDDVTSRAEYEQLKAERDQLVDRLARLQAEFENARKRAEREKAEFRDYAAGNVVEQFLPVLDNFELALKATGSTEQLRSGVELIVKQMEEVLRQMNVTAMPTVGEEFDPRHHEALGRWSGTICPISTWPKRFAAATRFARSCCGRRWCASYPIQNRR